MAEADSSAIGSVGEGSKKKRDGGSENGEYARTRTRPSKRLKTVEEDVSLLHEPSRRRNKRRWNEMVQTDIDMSIDEDKYDDDDEKKNTETEVVREEEYRSSRRRTTMAVNTGRGRGDSEDEDGLVRNGLGTVSLQERGESSEHVPDCEEEQKEAAAAAGEEEQEQQEDQDQEQEIWMRYCPQVNTFWKAQRLGKRGSAVLDSKKRKASGFEEEEEQQQQHPEEKKSRICRDFLAENGDHRVLGSEDTSMRQEEVGKRKWKRMPQSESSDVKSTDEMGVSVSEAWKRLREEDDEDSVHAHSNNGSSLSSETTTEKEMSQGAGGNLKKKVRVEKSYNQQGKKWRRQRKQAADGEQQNTGNSKRPHEDKDSESSSSGSSGRSSSPGGFSCKYLHNRMWKRPRFENLISVQGRMAGKQQQQQQRHHHHHVEESSKKRSATETLGMLKKRQRR
jgi:hypothetical protein